jgi:putative NADH-flavin reductase
MLMEKEDFPDFVKPISEIHKRALDLYKNLEGNKFNWINVSPAEIIEPDEKTGKYRIGTDDKVLFDENGRSFISMEDFASAVVDLIENETIKNQRITVSY